MSAGARELGAGVEWVHGPLLGVGCPPMVPRCPPMVPAHPPSPSSTAALPSRQPQAFSREQAAWLDETKPGPHMGTHRLHPQ